MGVGRLLGTKFGIAANTYPFLDIEHLELEARVTGVNARTKVAVLGNHDFWARPERLEDGLAQAGVRVLVDESLRLPPPHDDVALVGMDDPLTRLSVSDSLAREAELARALDEVRDLPVKIALCHSPDGFRSVRGKGIARRARVIRAQRNVR